MATAHWLHPTEERGRECSVPRTNFLAFQCLERWNEGGHRGPAEGIEGFHALTSAEHTLRAVTRSRRFL